MASTTASADPYARKWWVLLAVCLALFMAMIDGTVVNVSIPAISAGIGASFADAEWVLNAYTLVFASLLITFGRLGDMFGRKRFFLVGLVVFGIGSLFCGLATTPAILIGSRVLQAAGGAFMMPATLSLTAVSFPAEQRGMAMGIWGATSGLASAAGPLLGGWITDAFSWNYIFFINLPIVVLTLALAAWAVPESKDLRSHKVDFLGVVLSIAMLALLSYGLIEGPKLGWTDPTVLGLFGGSLVALAIFIVWERRVAEPIIDLRLFRNVGFSAGNASGAILMFGMIGMFFLLPVYLQAQLGYTAIQTGLTLMPLSATVLVSAPLAGRISDRIGSRWLIFSGMAIAAAAVFWASFLPIGAGWQWLAAPLAIAGIGMGLVMPSMTSAVMAVAPRGEEGEASGILSTMRQVGGLFGVAVLGAIFSTTMTAALLDRVPEVAGLPADAVPYVTTFIEESGSGMGPGMGGASLDQLREIVPDEAMAPLIADAVRAAAAATLPEQMQEPIAEAVIAEAVKGTAIDGTAMMTALGPVIGELAARGITAEPSAFMSFGTMVGSEIEKRFAVIGEGFAEAAKASFVAGIQLALRVASVVLLIGALLALLLKKGRNVESDLEALHVE